MEIIALRITHNRLHQLSGRVQFTLLSLLLLFSTNSFAGINVDSATPNSASPTTVALPNVTIAASMQVTTTQGGNNNDWDSYEWVITDGVNTTSSGCNNDPNFTSSEAHELIFDMTAPAIAGTYDVTYTAWRDDNCAGTQSTLNENGAVIVTAPDVTPPTLDSATVDCSNLSQITLTFSETLDTTTAQTASNYSIDGGPAISSAVLQGDGITVILTTATPLTSNTTYTNLNASGVEDNSGNAMTAYASPLTVPDCSLVGPTLDTVAVNCDPTSPVTLVFSKTLDQTSAETTTNYTLNNGATINAATLQADGVTVVLTTNPAPLADTTLYTFTANNVTDTLANAMTPYNDTFTTQDCTGSIVINSASPNTASPASVYINDTIAASMTVTTSGNGWRDDWESFEWLITDGVNSTSSGCIETPAYSTDGTYTDYFNMTAPAVAGTYDAVYTAYHQSGCSGTNHTLMESNAVIITVDSIAPTLDSAVVDCATLNQITLTFSETLDQTSAETATNYTIDGGPTVASASLRADGITVILATDSDLVSNTTYSNLNASGVTDLAGNLMTAYSSSLTVPNCDLIGPTLDTVATTCADNTQLTLTFSEALDQTSAETSTNYLLDGGVTVASAALQVDQVTVILTTSGFSEQTTYTLTANSVTDTGGNAMTPYSDTFIYPKCIGTFPFDQCAADRFGADLGCTAADVSITGLTLGAGSPTRCEGGATISVNLEVTVNFAAPDRYDVGIFLSKDGLPPDTTIASGGATSCTVSTLPNTSPFLDLDPGPDGGGTTDTCGDGNNSINGGLGYGTHYMSNVEVPCQANPVSDGGLFIPFVVTWDSQSTPSGGTCTSNLDPVPSTKSKCNAPDVTLPAEVALTTIDIVVMPKITFDDSLTAIRVGNTNTYTVTIENTTGADLDNAILKSPVVDGLTNYSLTSCTATGGATCPAVNATTLADIQDSVNGLTLATMPADSTLVFTISADMTSAPDPLLTSEASITVSRPSAGTTETETVTDVNTILPHHYAISHSGTGITCEASLVTITAHRDPNFHNLTTQPSGLTTITLSTTPAADYWALKSGGGAFNPATNEYTFSGSEDTVEFWLTETSATTSPHIDIDIVDNVADNVGGFAYDDDGDATEDANIEFRSSVFRFVDTSSASPFSTITVGNQIAGKPSTTAPDNQSIGLQPIETNTTTNECEVSFSSQSVAVNLAYLCNDPAPASCNTATNLSLSPAATYNAVGSTNLTGSNNSGSLNYTPVTLTFDANGIAPLSFIYSDAGSVTLYAEKTLTADPSATPPVSATTLLGSTNSFVVRPFGFDLDFDNNRFDDWSDDTILNDSPSGDNSYAADVSGSKFVKAGASFNTQITAVVWQDVDDDNNTGGDTANDGIPDSDANLTDNSETYSFGTESGSTDLALGATLVIPSVGGNPGSLTPNKTVTAGSGCTASATVACFINGVAEITLSWDEVGVLNISETQSNFLGSGMDISGTAYNVGRFYPDRFSISDNSPSFINTNTSGTTPFTYLGQNFYYGTAPVITITALNEAGGTTRNYGGTGADRLWNLNSALAGRSYDNKSAASATFTSALAGAGSVTLAEDTDFDGDGTLSLTSGGGGDSFAYNKNGEETPFSADIDLTLSITDLTDNDSDLVDKVCYDSDNDDNCDEYVITNITGAALRYGRIDLLDTYGDKSLGSLIPLPLKLEYYDGIGFVPNDDDEDTTINSTNLTCAPASTAIACANVSITASTIGHGGGFTLSTLTNNSGSLIYSITTTPSHLVYDWDEDAGTADSGPTATATFGGFRDDDRFIFWREVEGQ